ncbi:MAG: YbhB/YbcL family Raf kinase inhibitor-like protein [Candidatus Dormibacteraeota bacterium]|nr:YbhB/YbcL family Raf kinase inhibitor-like protein [Candidatus Dormibacteraeota bacterium]
MSLLEIIFTPLGWLLRGKRAGEERCIGHAPQLASDVSIALSSPAFTPGESIPAAYCGGGLGDNISPALTWSGPPAGTAQLLLVMEDVDVPFSHPGLHLIALLDVGATGVREGALNDGAPKVRFVPDRRGRTGYIGPRPLPGHGVHRYRFHLYAIEEAIPATRRLTGFEDVLAAVDGHVLAHGRLEGVRRS